MSESETCQKNIIVEITRPEIKLGKEQFDQIERYANDIRKEPIYNANNIFLEYYLIGDDIDDYIKTNKIDSMKNYGEIQRGLSLNIENGKAKIYVRKWSDILEVEWEHKIKYLKDKLQIEAKEMNYANPQEIVKQHTNS
jgi:hypothetical protein